MTLAERQRALARNAIWPALKPLGWRLPLYVRNTIADAVLDALDSAPPTTGDEQPDRRTADTITDDELDALYEERLKYGRGWAAADQRARAAEAVLDHLRAALDQVIAETPKRTRAEARANTFGAGVDWTVRLIRAALDDKEPTR